MDMLDLGSARTYYRQAITAAKLAKNDVLAVYMTGSLAAFEIDAADDPLLGLAMIAKARETLPLSAGSTPTAWLASLEALAHASNPTRTSTPQLRHSGPPSTPSPAPTAHRPGLGSTPSTWPSSHASEPPSLSA